MADNTGSPVNSETARQRGRQQQIELSEEEFRKTLDFSGEVSDDKAPEDVQYLEEPDDRRPTTTLRSPETTREELKPKEKTDIEKALETIGNMQREIDTLKRGTVGDRKTETRDERPDLEEVITNVRLPKDRTKWAVQLTEADIEKVGIDKSATVGLNILANAVVQYMSDALPPIIMNQVQNWISTREDLGTEQVRFLDEHQDLAGHEDIMSIVEERIWEDNKHLPKSQYKALLAKETRSRIAAIRGQSIEDYMASLPKRGEGEEGRQRIVSRSASPASRARTTSSSGGARSTIQRPRDGEGQRRELDDTLGI